MITIAVPVALVTRATLGAADIVRFDGGVPGDRLVWHTSATSKLAWAHDVDHIVDHPRYGAVNGGTTGDTAANTTAINAAIAAAGAGGAAGGGRVTIPAGGTTGSNGFFRTRALSMLTPYTEMSGVSLGSRFRFEPTGANQIAVTVGAGATTQYLNAVRNLVFFGTDTTNKKTAIQIDRPSQAVIEDVQIGVFGLNWVGGDSIGIRTTSTGGVVTNEHVRIHRTGIYADRPFVIGNDGTYSGPGGAAVASADWYHVTDSQWVSEAGATRTGNTHTSTLVDGITSTAGLTAGMSVAGSGFQSGTTIASVAANSITLSLATTTSLTGTTLTFRSTHPIVDVEDGTGVSNLFMSNQSWNRGAGAGFQYITTVANSPYDGQQIKLENIKREQEGDGLVPGLGPLQQFIHVEAPTATPINGFVVDTATFGTTKGIKLRGVNNVSIRNIQSPTGLVGLDADGTVKGLVLENFAAGTLSLSGLTAVYEAKIGAQVIKGIYLPTSGITYPSALLDNLGVGTAALPTTGIAVTKSVAGPNSVRVSVTNTDASGLADLVAFNDGGAAAAVSIGGSTKTGTIWGVTWAGFARLTATGGPAGAGTDVAQPFYFATNQIVRATVGSSGGLMVGALGARVDEGSGTVNVTNGYYVADAALNFSHLSGSVTAAQTPAFTGDVTKSAGSATTVLANIPSGVAMAGSLLATAIAAPGTPAAGKGSVWFDSTAKVLMAKGDAGVVSHGVQSVSGAIDDNGSITSSGTGGFARVTSPTFTTPILGDATGTSVKVSGSIWAGNTTGFGSYVFGATAAPNEDFGVIGKLALSDGVALVSIDSGNASLRGMELRASTLDFHVTAVQINEVALNFSHLAGSVSGAQTPAFTGDVTKSAGGTVTVLANIPTATPMAGYLAATAIAAPGTPSAGVARIYVDSTSKNLAAKDDAGNVNHGIRSVTGAIADDGSITSSGTGGFARVTSPALTTPTFATSTALSGSAASNGSIRASVTNTHTDGYADTFMFNQAGKFAGFQIAGSGVTSTFAGITNANIAKFTTNADNFVVGSDGVAAPIHFVINTSVKWVIGASAGLYSGGATGTDKGAGTINAGGAYYSNGTIGVGTVGTGTAVTLPLTAFTTAGGLVTVATGTSDQRLKDVYDDEFLWGINELRGIEMRRFSRRLPERGAPEWGFIAQNVERSFSAAVGVERWDADATGQERWAAGSEWKTVNERMLLGATIRGVVRVDDRLTTEINDVKSQIGALTARLADLETRRN